MNKQALPDWIQTQRKPTARGQRGGASQDRAKNPTETGGRVDALVLPQDGSDAEAQQVHGATRVGTSAIEAAPSGRLPGVQRSTFEEKAADIIGLYMNPPQHAAVFCVDEKTAIQALDRLDPVLPLSPGRAERHGFEYYRHGTLSLYAALDVKTGQVHGMTAGRHTSQEFIAFLEGLVARTPWAQEIHVVLDNLSEHKTKDVERFLAEHPQVRFHFTPTYSSWLNQDARTFV